MKSQMSFRRVRSLETRVSIMLSSAMSLFYIAKPRHVQASAPCVSENAPGSTTQLLCQREANFCPKWEIPLKSVSTLLTLWARRNLGFRFKHAPYYNWTVNSLAL